MSSRDRPSPNRPRPNRPRPNRPKARSDAQPLITSAQRRRLLGGSFAQQQSLAEAQEYDAVRPRYPQQAVADILALAAESAAAAARHPSGSALPHSAAPTSDSSAAAPDARRCADSAPPAPDARRPADTTAQDVECGICGVNGHLTTGQPPQNSHSISGRGPRVTDLGAGTGILSRALLDAGAWVHAVEPSTAMTQVLASTAGPHAERLQITHAPAEATGLPSAEADLVVAAQAWHWFDAEAVQTEIARLLVPGGALALIWNYLDTADPTVHRLTRIMRAGDTYRPGWRPTLDAERFSPVQTTEYRWTRTLPVAEIFRYATTLSSWLAAEDAERARRRNNLSDYLHRELGLANDDAVELPQITALHTAHAHFVATLRR